MELPVILFILWSLVEVASTAYNTDCKYLKVTDTWYQGDRNGRYSILGEHLMCNGRQSYKQNDNGNFIYFLELSDGWRGWMIGTTLCVNKGGMAVRDTAVSPDQVTGMWEEVKGDQWVSTRAQVECTGALTTGTIVGIVIGVLLLVLSVVGIIMCCYKGKKRKGTIHGVGPAPPHSHRPAVSTISQARGPNRATVRRGPPPGPPPHGQQQSHHGYLGPAYQPPPQQQAPPHGWHAHPIAPPAYSNTPPAYPPSIAYPPGGPQPKPEGFAAYPASSMAPVDSGPPPSYRESQNHQVFTNATVHPAPPGNMTGRRPPPANPTPTQPQPDDIQ